MPSLTNDLMLIERDFYNNKDSRVLNVWSTAKMKWFFPKIRKHRIEKRLYKNYLAHYNAIVAYYRQHL